MRTATAVLVAALMALACCAPARATTAPPIVTAKSAIVMEASTGEVVYARNPDQSRPMASTTKLMTVLLALERIAPGDVLTAPGYHAGPAESRINLRAGERMKVADLLRAALLPSANDAAAALAQGVAGSRAAFIREMNAKARELKLAHTHYSTPVGLDRPGNYSSARDLARLALRLRRYRIFREIVDRPRAVLHSGDHVRTVVNRNLLVRDVPWVTGIKTGHTLDAGYVLVGSGTRHGVTVVSVVMGEPNESARDVDSLRLLRFGLSRFRLARPLRAGHAIARPEIHYRSGERVDLVPARSVSFVARRGRHVTVRVDAPTRVDGPLRRGAVVGSAQVRYGGRPVAQVDLLTAQAVPAAGIGRRLTDSVTRTWIWVVLLVVAATGVPLALLRRRARRRRRTGVKTKAA